MLSIKEDTSGKPMKLLTWDKVFLECGDKKEFPIKKITIEIAAGGFAEMVVERYANTKYENGCSVRTLDENGKDIFLTFKEKWALADSEQDICIVARRGLTKE